LVCSQDILGANLAHLSDFCQSSLSMSQQIGILSQSRWLECGSLRSLERFFATSHDWTTFSCALGHHFLKVNPSKEGVLLLDSTTVPKSGKKTHGMGKHYSTTSGQVERGLGILNLSLGMKDKSASLPLGQEMIIFTEAQLQKQAEERAKKKEKKEKKEGKLSDSPEAAPHSIAKKGRKKGTQNGVEKEIPATYQAVSVVLSRVLSTWNELSDKKKLHYLVGDAGFSSPHMAKIAQSNGLHLVSRFQNQIVLKLPYAGEKNKKGAPSKYGERVAFCDGFAEKYATFCKGIYTKETKKRTTYYKIFHFSECLHSNYSMPLNVVFTFPCDKNGKLLETKNKGIFFTTDLSLTAEALLDLYDIRYMIEENFRTAKQYFGLRGFKNYKQTQVLNRIGSAFFMVTYSRLLLFELRKIYPQWSPSVEDLQVFFQVQKYESVFKIGGDQNTPPILNKKNKKQPENNPFFAMINQIVA
jgi:putative transposase